MADNITLFQETHPSLDSYWRSVILFGRNVASYKFALAKSLLEIAPTGKTEITLEELADPFSRHLCEHIAHSPRQVTSPGSQFLDACRSYNDGTSTHEALNGYQKGKCFYCFDDISIGDLDDAANPVQFDKLDIETDEPAGPKILRVSEERPLYGKPPAGIIGLTSLFSKNDTPHILVSPDNRSLADVPSLDPLTTSNVRNSLCDVDHFFPYTLQRYIPEVNLNGVWNLVLTCKHCNRGEDGKFAGVPTVKYLERLHARNEFLINSHHPLRDTLMHQAGAQPADRIAFLKTMDAFAINKLIQRWETKQVREAAF